MNTSGILIAYPTGGEPVALRLFETLNDLGTMTLRPYSRLKSAHDGQRFDVALCIVTDDASIEEAHELQHRLDDVPTIVVDSTVDTTIPINGFVGRVPPAPRSILKAVTEILDPDCLGQAVHSPASQKARPREALASRFDNTLSRLGGLSQGYDTMLAAATRQLAWELRAGSAEACVVDSAKRVRQVYSSSPCPPDTQAVSAGVCRILKSRRFLICRTDLTRKEDAALIDYLDAQRLNVIAPIMPANRLIGWVSFRLDEELLTDTFLDDLRIATHLLSLTLKDPAEETAEKVNPWHHVLIGFNAGMLIFDTQGKIVDLMGETQLLGSIPLQGQAFKSIRNSHIREVIAEALRGNFTAKTWTDPLSDQSFTCSATALDTMMALRYGQATIDSRRRDGCSSPMIELTSFLESLKVPVVADGVSSSPTALPKGRISVEDSNCLRRCAQAAISCEAKALRIRFQGGEKWGRAVLFFETPTTGTESRLGSDIEDAVEFHVIPL